MKHNIKSFLTTPFVCLILIISMLALPINASAETGTLGTETPSIYCEFTNSIGRKVDGGRLVPGTYTVDIILSGMQAFSILEVSADFNTEIITNLVVSGTYADTADDVRLGGQKVENGMLSVFQIAENELSSSIDANGTVMITLDVTISSSCERCDFENVFEFSTDPTYMFVMASYADGYDDCYVLDTTIETGYRTFPMTADPSPYFPITEFYIVGTVTIADDLVGSSTAYGAADVTVSVDGTDISAQTNADGSYTLGPLKANEYTLTISGPTTLDRSVTLIVDSENADYDQITVNSVGVVIADYNKDGRINATDAMLFSNGTSYSDYNADGVIDESDANAFRTFLGKTVNYTDITLN